MSRIKYLEDIKNKELEDIFQFDVDDIENYERNKERLDNFDHVAWMKEKDEELDKLISSLTVYDWKYEIKSDKSNIFTLTTSGVDKKIIAEVCEYAFLELGRVEHYTIDYLHEELFTTNAKLREIIFSKFPLHINKLKNITYLEAVESIKNSSHAYNQVIDKFVDNRDYLIWLHLHYGHEFEKITNWQNHLDTSMITFIIADSDRMVEYDYELLKNNQNFNITHKFMMIKKEPSAINILSEVSDKFDEVYVKYHDDEEQLFVEIRNILINYKTNFYTLLHPLFEKGHVTFTDIYKSYKKLYT